MARHPHWQRSPRSRTGIGQRSDGQGPEGRSHLVWCWLYSGDRSLFLPPPLLTLPAVPTTGRALLLLTPFAEETGIHHSWILVPFLTLLGSVGDWVGPSLGPGPEYFLYLSLILSFLHRMVEYSLDLQNINLSAIRTVRVLRPLKAINRVPSELDLPAHPSPPAQLAPLTYSEKTDWFLPGPELRSQCWTNVTLLPLNSWASLWYPEVLGRGS